ncbi:MAG: hypothetical protein ACN6O7_16460, partial [Sphingobacterium sp.]
CNYHLPKPLHSNLIWNTDAIESLPEAKPTILVLFHLGMHAYIPQVLAENNIEFDILMDSKVFAKHQEEMSARTDSNFRFHPDSGLIGQRGQLAMLESKVNTSAKNKLSTNSSDSFLQTQHKFSTEKRSAWAVPDLWLIGSVFLAVAIAWKFRKFFKTFLG